MQKKPFSSKSDIFKAPEGELKAPEALSEKVFFVSDRVQRNGPKQGTEVWGETGCRGKEGKRSGGEEEVGPGAETEWTGWLAGWHFEFILTL